MDQPARKRVEQLIEDLQAPRKSRKAAAMGDSVRDVRALLAQLEYSVGNPRGGGGATGCKMCWARWRFGKTFSQSLPRMERWIRTRLSGIELLAQRKELRYLQTKVNTLSKLARLTTDNPGEVENHLRVLADAYELAGYSMLATVRHRAAALTRAQDATAALTQSEVDSRAPSLVGEGYDFERSFPRPRRGTRDDKPDPTISDEQWIAAQHQEWWSALRLAQGTISWIEESRAHAAHPGSSPPDA